MNSIINLNTYSKNKNIIDNGSVKMRPKQMYLIQLSLTLIILLLINPKPTTASMTSFLSPNLMSGYPRYNDYYGTMSPISSKDPQAIGPGSYGGYNNYGPGGMGYGGKNVMAGVRPFQPGMISSQQVGYGFGLAGSSLDAALYTTYQGGKGGAFYGNNPGHYTAGGTSDYTTQEDSYSSGPPFAPSTPPGFPSRYSGINGSYSNRGYGNEGYGSGYGPGSGGYGGNGGEYGGGVGKYGGDGGQYSSGSRFAGGRAIYVHDEYEAWKAIRKGRSTKGKYSNDLQSKSGLNFPSKKYAMQTMTMISSDATKQQDSWSDSCRSDRCLSLEDTHGEHEEIIIQKVLNFLQDPPTNSSFEKNTLSSKTTHKFTTSYYPMYGDVIGPSRTARGYMGSFRDLNGAGVVEDSRYRGRGYNLHGSVLDGILGGQNIDIILPRSQRVVNTSPNTIVALGPAREGGVVVPSVGAGIVSNVPSDHALNSLLRSNNPFSLKNDKLFQTMDTTVTTVDNRKKTSFQNYFINKMLRKTKLHDSLSLKKDITSFETTLKSNNHLIKKFTEKYSDSYQDNHVELQKSNQKQILRNEQHISGGAFVRGTVGNKPVITFTSRPSNHSSMGGNNTSNNNPLKFEDTKYSESNYSIIDDDTISFSVHNDYLKNDDFDDIIITLSQLTDFENDYPTIKNNLTSSSFNSNQDLYFNDTRPFLLGNSSNKTKIPFTIPRLMMTFSNSEQQNDNSFEIKHTDQIPDDEILDLKQLLLEMEDLKNTYIPRDHESNSNKDEDEISEKIASSDIDLSFKEVNMSSNIDTDLDDRIVDNNSTINNPKPNEKDDFSEWIMMPDSFVNDNSDDIKANSNLESEIISENRRNRNRPVNLPSRSSSRSRRRSEQISEREKLRDALLEEWEKEKEEERMQSMLRNINRREREEDLAIAQRVSQGVGIPGIYGRGFGSIYFSGDYRGGSSAFGSPGGIMPDDNYSKNGYKSNYYKPKYPYSGPYVDSSIGNYYDSISYLPTHSRSLPGMYSNYNSYLTTDSNLVSENTSYKSPSQSIPKIYGKRFQTYKVQKSKINNGFTFNTRNNNNNNGEIYLKRYNHQNHVKYFSSPLLRNVKTMYMNNSYRSEGKSSVTTYQNSKRLGYDVKVTEPVPIYQSNEKRNIYGKRKYNEISNLNDKHNYGSYDTSMRYSNYYDDSYHASFAALPFPQIGGSYHFLSGNENDYSYSKYIKNNIIGGKGYTLGDNGYYDTGLGSDISYLGLKRPAVTIRLGGLHDNSINAKDERNMVGDKTFFSKTDNTSPKIEDFIDNKVISNPYKDDGGISGRFIGVGKRNTNSKSNNSLKVKIK